MQVDDHIRACAEAACPPHDVQEGGKVRLGKAAGDFEGHVSGIDIHTDKHTQFMVHGVLQRDTSKSQLHNSAKTLRGCCPCHKPARPPRPQPAGFQAPAGGCSGQSMYWV